MQECTKLAALSGEQHHADVKSILGTVLILKRPDSFIPNSITSFLRTARIRVDKRGQKINQEVFHTYFFTVILESVGKVRIYFKKLVPRCTKSFYPQFASKQFGTTENRLRCNGKDKCSNYFCDFALKRPANSLTDILQALQATSMNVPLEKWVSAKVCSSSLN